MSNFNTTWHENIILFVCNSVVVAYTQRPVAPEPGHLGHWNFCQMILRSTLSYMSTQKMFSHVYLISGMRGLIDFNSFGHYLIIIPKHSFSSKFLIEISSNSKKPFQNCQLWLKKIRKYVNIFSNWKSIKSSCQFFV